MFCRYCGNNLPDDSIFCNGCGKRQNTADNQLLPTPPLPVPPMEVSQAPVRNVPIVQGTPSALTPPSSSTPIHTPSFVSHVTSPVGQQQPRLKGSRPISRRAVIAGLSDVAGVAAVGGLALGIGSGAIRLPFLSGSSSAPTQPSVPTKVGFPMFGFDAQHTHFNPYEYILNPENVSHLVSYWTASMGGSDASPTVVNGVVYIGSFDYNLYALVAKTGSILWKVPIGDTALASPPVNEDRLISSAAVVDEVVYIGSLEKWDSTNHKLYAFNAKTGTTLWTIPFSGVIFMSSPTVINGVVYVGSLDSNLYALDARTGRTLWTASTGGQIESSPVVANGIVYINSGDQNLYAFDAQTGKALWKSAGASGLSPAVANGIVYAGSSAFDAKTGTVVWRGLTVSNSSPAVANGIVYAVDSNLHAFDAKSGKKLWETANENLFSSPTVANGVVYITSFGDKLLAFDTLNGKKLWMGSIGSNSISTPTIANGVIYTATDKMYVFHLPPGTM